MITPDLMAEFQDSVETRTVIAGEEYQSNWFRKLIAGNLWRDLWTTPFTAPVLDLKNFANGLTPTKTGGGMQTRSLHFNGNDGKRYKFRSIDKDPTRSLPADLKETFIAEEMQDQVPVQSPVSSIIVAPLMNALGIINSVPEIVILPDDENLAEFRSEFKNMLGTIEENPDDYEDDDLNFAGSDKVVSTFKLFEKLESDNDESVDAEAFLKVRLLDVLIGDRDRHAGQWKWAGFKQKGKRIWKPIPKDRDYAFPLYDGLIPLIMRIARTSIVHFDYKMPAMIDVTWEGRHLDRRFLGSLNKHQWDSIAVFIINSLNDDAIENAVKSIPPELFELRGQEIIDKLKSRRSQLKKASDEFYELANKYVDIYGSDKKEYAEITRYNDGFADVRIFKHKPNLPDEKGELLFERTFDHLVTNEIRIHLLDGDDKAIVRGKVDDGIRIIIDGGEGKDHLTDSSEVRKKLLGILPIDINSAKTEFYDSGKKTTFHPGRSTRIITKAYPEPATPELKYEPVVENRSWDFRALIPFEIDPDYGLIIGAGGAFNFYDYRIEPYSYRLGLSGSYSTATREFEIISEGIFHKLLDGIKVNLFLKYSGMEITRFFGFGNETLFEDALEDADFYDVRQRKYFASSTFEFPAFSDASFYLGLSYERSVLNESEGDLINELSLNGEGIHTTLSFLSGFRYDSRDNNNLPYSGQSLEVGLLQAPSFINFSDTYGKLELVGRSFHTSNLISRETIALKVNAQYVWGKYPFFNSAYIGGKNSLRGFHRNRFSGEASISLQTDLRFLLGKIILFIPGEFGFNVVNDFGRVFFDDVSSNKIHSAHGGGIWFSVLDRLLTINMNVVKSKEDTRFYLSTGYSF